MIRRMLLLVMLMGGLGLLTIQPSQSALAQGVAWTGQYYNNPYLFEPVTVTRTDSAVAFDWGTGSPAQGIGVDGFSVRWGADPYFTAGTYRFWALADDLVKVNVGYAFAPQIDTFADPKIGQIVSADVTLTEGVHHVQVDYREVTGNAYVYVTWANLATNPAGPNFPAPSGTGVNVNAGPWTAQYFTNTALIGSPVLVRGEISPSNNWGAGSPAPNVPVDNFSARWTSVQSLDAGQYTLSVQADDGIRVFVNGGLVINEWHGATGLTYTATLNLGAGAHSFLVEYYEAGGNAFVNYNLARAGGAPVINPPVAVSGTTATVNTATLNFRNGPSTGAQVLQKLRRGETYPVSGTTADQSWWQINVNGVTGWVFGRWVTISGSTNVVVTGQSQSVSQPVDTGYIVTALDTVNVRGGPARTAAILAKMPIRATARVVGRTANNGWWQVNFDGVTGWVSSTYALLQPDAQTARIPVTG